MKAYYLSLICLLSGCATQMDLPTITLLNERLGRLEKQKTETIETPKVIQKVKPPVITNNTDSKTLNELNELNERMVRMEKQKQEETLKIEQQTVNLLNECINRLEKQKTETIIPKNTPEPSPRAINASTNQIIEQPPYNPYPNRLNDAQRDFINFMLNYLADED